MRFRNLGPLEVWEDGREVSLASGRQRALLSLLLLRADEVVSIDRLIDDLWSGRPPASAPKVVQGYVSQLRRALGPDAIVTRGSGYLLPAPDTDAAEFARLVAVARSQDPRGASATLRTALDLWRGKPFADVEYEEWAQAEIGRIEELRLTALEERIDADIALGRHAEAIGELESLIAANPLRERLRGLLMFALYRSDRQGEALEAYRAARSTLVEELGIEPSKALQKLEQEILTQDPGLDADARPTAPALPPGRAPAPVGTVTFLSIDIEGSTMLERELRRRYGDVLAEFRRVVRSAVDAVNGHEVDTQGDAFLIAFGSARSAVEAALVINEELARGPLAGATQLRVRMGIHSGEPAVGPEGYYGIAVVRASRICAAGHGEQILLSNAARELVEADLPADVELHDLGVYSLKGITQPEHLYQLDVAGAPREFAALRHAMPATRSKGPLRLLRSQSRRRVVAIFAAGLLLLAAGIGAAVHELVPGHSTASVVAVPNSLAAIDPKTDAPLADIPVGNTPTEIAVGAGSVWVLNSNEQNVSRVDPATMTVLRDIPTPMAATGIAVRNGFVWASGAHDLVRINPNLPVDPVSVKLPANRNPLARIELATVAATPSGVWAGTTDAVVRVAPAPKEQVVLAETGCCTPVAVGLGSVWTGGDFGVDRVSAVSAAREAHISLPFHPGAIAVGAGTVWVADESGERIWQIDPKLNAVGGTVQVGAHPADIALGYGSLWVASSDGSVVRIAAATGRVVARIAVGGTPRGIAVGFGKVWVSVG